MSIIPVRSKRQAMDWSLVLASQEIPTVIERFEDDRWGLMVERQDLARALQTLRQYRIENRRWRWQQPLPVAGAPFHWGGCFWCLWLILIYRVSMIDAPELIQFGRMDSQAVGEGQWWRLFTAVFLHADLGHLLANVTTGALLFGLAMASYGPGMGLLISYLSGAVGNVFGLALYARAYWGLGASGMVMGALGLITVHTIASWRQSGFASLRPIIRALFAGTLLFVILGMNRSSDVLAHLGGFVGGMAIGSIIMFLPKKPVIARKVDSICGIVLAILVFWTWHLAIQAGKGTP